MKRKKRIEFYPIGIIETPYDESINIPIQGSFDKETKGCVNLYQEFQEGLKDLDGFTHAYLIYFFHKAHKTTLVGKPFLEDADHGVFAIRSHFRPNKIGFTLVRIERMVENRLYFTGVDMLNGSPVLDIKPFVNEFDRVENAVSGWTEKHFQGSRFPERVILNKK